MHAGSVSPTDKFLGQSGWGCRRRGGVSVLGEPRVTAGAAVGGGDAASPCVTLMVGENCPDPQSTARGRIQPHTWPFGRRCTDGETEAQ